MTSTDFYQSVIQAVWINMKRKPYADPRVRRAMHLALDKHVLVDVVKDVAPMMGSLWGLACGDLGGRFDLVSQRIMEVFRAFPDLILAMAISMAIGTGLPAVIVAIAITRIPFGGRVIRSVALTIREQAYVEAGRAAGATALRMMALHVLPQCVAPYLVLATTHLGVAIVIEAALGFLGVGVPPPTPTWGNMLADSLTSLVPHWWLVLFPGLAITVTVLAFNLLGDGIRDTLDSRLSPAFLRLATAPSRAAAPATATARYRSSQTSCMRP
jgi:ABC-type dipeptide/oligopeptide/nickel transport system permease subunit